MIYRAYSKYIMDTKFHFSTCKGFRFKERTEQEEAVGDADLPVDNDQHSNDEKRSPVGQIQN